MSAARSVNDLRRSQVLLVLWRAEMPAHTNRFGEVSPRYNPRSPELPMSPRPGTSIGTYAPLSGIGPGGMGEACEASNTRLNRARARDLKLPGDSGVISVRHHASDFARGCRYPQASSPRCLAGSLLVTRDVLVHQVMETQPADPGAPVVPAALVPARPTRPSTASCVPA